MVRLRENSVHAVGAADNVGAPNGTDDAPQIGEKLTDGLTDGSRVLGISDGNTVDQSKLVDLEELNIPSLFIRFPSTVRL